MLVDEQNHKLVLFGGYTGTMRSDIASEKSAEMTEAILKSLQKYPTPLTLSNTEAQYKKSLSWANQITIK